MSTHDNRPPPADWTPCVGNICGTCQATANLCSVLLKVDDKACCQGCTHRGVREPLVWDGDQA